MAKYLCSNLSLVYVILIVLASLSIAVPAFRLPQPKNQNDNENSNYENGYNVEHEEGKGVELKHSIKQKRSYLDDQSVAELNLCIFGCVKCSKMSGVVMRNRVRN